MINSNLIIFYEIHEILLYRISHTTNWTEIYNSYKNKCFPIKFYTEARYSLFDFFNCIVIYSKAYLVSFILTFNKSITLLFICVFCNIFTHYCTE